MKRFLSICILSAAICVGLQAQSLERQVIAATGGFAESSSVSLSYTVGEPVIETAVSGTVILTQGFQQPNPEDFVGIAEIPGIELNYTVYPNPTMDRVFVEMTTKESVDVQLTIHDIQGKLIGNLTREVNVYGTTQEEINLQGLAAGNYLLILNDVEGKAVETFKIQKIN